MKLLHLSSRSNRDSILKHGLLPSKISLDSHRETFQDSGLIGDKCVYTWDADKGQSTDKYIRDMIYCKLFIHPRNKIVDEREILNKRLHQEGKLKDWEDKKNWVDFRTLGTKLYGSSNIYDLYEIEIDKEDPLLLQNFWMHGQGCEEDECHTSTVTMMNNKYAHYDKVLHIANDIILPEQLTLVDSVKTRLYKNDTIGLSYSKNI
jgi:hypothetical protein